VCVWPGKPYKRKQNVPTKMAIPEILVLVRTFFGPHERKKE